MAENRYSETSEDVIENFMGIVRKKAEIGDLRYKFLTDIKQKVLVKISKMSDKHVAAFEKDIFVVINEDMYDKFEDEDVKILLEEEIDKIFVNNETGKITFRQFDMQTFSGIISKYGMDKVSKAKQIEVLSHEQTLDMDSGFTS